jgi:hypothetical protein
MLLMFASESWDGTPPGGRRFFISGPCGGRSSLLYPIESPAPRDAGAGDEEARWLSICRRYTVRSVVPLIFQDAVGVLMIGKMLPEAADVVLHDAVAGEKPRGQAVEVVEPMSIPLELVDEPSYIGRQRADDVAAPRHEEDLGRDLRRHQISRRYWLISTPAATSSACDFEQVPETPR